MERTLLQVKNLRTYFYHREKTIRAVDGVDFEIAGEKIFALVGESGSGKSVTALSITNLIPRRIAKIVSGEVIFLPARSAQAGEGEDILKFDEEKLRGIRGGKISYVFQEVTTSLNPVLTAGSQIVEAVRLHKGLNKSAAMDYAEELLKRVRIPAARMRLNSYPHELSGGMKQRAMIAMAIASDPALLIADEPTTALDVTIQAQILDLLNEMRKSIGLSILLITHDLSIVRQIADEVAVMYLGRIVERAAVTELLNNPLHPYTAGLLGCVPKRGEPKKKFVFIRGRVQDPSCEAIGCRYCARCEAADEQCEIIEPKLGEAKPGHWVRCVKAVTRNS